MSSIPSRRGSRLPWEQGVPSNRTVRTGDVRDLGLQNAYEPVRAFDRRHEHVPGCPVCRDTVHRNERGDHQTSVRTLDPGRLVRPRGWRTMTEDPGHQDQDQDQ